MFEGQEHALRASTSCWRVGHRRRILGGCCGVPFRRFRLLREVLKGLLQEQVVVEGDYCLSDLEESLMRA